MRPEGVRASKTKRRLEKNNDEGQELEDVVLLGLYVNNILF